MLVHETILIYKLKETSIQVSVKVCIYDSLQSRTYDKYTQYSLIIKSVYT